MQIYKKPYIDFVVLLGAIIGDTNIHESTEVQDAGRYIATPGSDRHGQILPHFKIIFKYWKSICHYG
jgi:hypothetical protein